MKRKATRNVYGKNVFVTGASSGIGEAGRKDPPARVPVGLEYKALMLLLRVMPDRGKEFILRKMYLPEK